MRISLKWLEELVQINCTPEDLAKTLTIAGFEVEEIEDLKKQADGVVIGKVIDCQPHPNANKLNVCQVDIGMDSPSNIVCGASNVKADIYVPVAKIGTYLPAIDLKLRAAKLRGVASEGMICSLAELGLEKESSGIHIFSQENLTVGSDVRPLLGLDDVILDTTTTANRADALSMVGVAREVAALTGEDFKLPPVNQLSIPVSNENNSLEITDGKACPAYIATVIEGVKIAPSPDWLKWRLLAAGVRPINNVVDITNYILLEWGQPLHAFDRERLQSVAESSNLQIGVRFARENESLTTLDSQQRQLHPQNLLITANDYPVALAGVMGGEETEVHQETKNIVLEAALFDPVAIRRSSRSQGLRSEASTRYERGVNYAELEFALNRAITLIQELAQGNPVSQVKFDKRGEISQLSTSIQLRLSRINHILGPVKLEPSGKQNNSKGYIQASEVEAILTRLGCKLEKIEEIDHVWNVTVPPYRYRDLEREIDLIEEVARLYGLDRFCDQLPEETEPGYLSFEEQVKRYLRESFRAVGLTEVVQYSLVKPSSNNEILLGNPLLAEYSALRNDLISGLINAFEYNLSQGNGALNAFEIGRIFWKEDGLKETDSVAGIIGGDYAPIGRWIRSGKESPMTWYEAKGILESVFSRLGFSVEYQPDHKDDRLHPGRTASLWLNGKHLGVFGQLHPQLRQERDLPDSVYVFQLNFEVLLAALNNNELVTPKFKAYSTYPGVERDLAFFAPVDLNVASIQQEMKKAGKSILNRIELFDLYLGENVPEGQKSLAFSLVYKAEDRTLTDEEVDPVHNKIREAIVEKFNLTLRS